MLVSTGGVEEVKRALRDVVHHYPEYCSIEFHNPAAYVGSRVIHEA